MSQSLLDTMIDEVADFVLEPVMYSYGYTAQDWDAQIAGQVVENVTDWILDRNATVRNAMPDNGIEYELTPASAMDDVPF